MSVTPIRDLSLMSNISPQMRCNYADFALNLLIFPVILIIMQLQKEPCEAVNVFETLFVADSVADETSLIVLGTNYSLETDF